MISEAIIQHFEKVYILEPSLDSKIAQRVIKFFPEHKIEICPKDPFLKHRGTLTADEFDKSKKLLLIKPFEGQFFKRCPGAHQKKVLTCCNYYVLNLGQQCNMNCSYCYLQSYLNSPALHLYSNIEKALLELQEMADSFPDKPFRIGTGEVMDSLSLDEISLYSHDLISFFKKVPSWTLEFKTKSNKVDHFLDCDHANNVVVSWSLNTDYISKTEEHGTASLLERLQAARKCVDRGFKIAFHLDPIIYYPNWEQGYDLLVDNITQMFGPNEVHSLSMGALRFQPEQRHMMRERFGMNSWVTRAEMFKGEGSKLRYDLDLRNKMFQRILGRFKACSDQWKIYMCMETPESWISTYSATPMKIPEIKDLFQPLPKLEREQNKGSQI